jgi:TIR domain
MSPSDRSNDAVWDIFVAYPSANWRDASNLFDALVPHVTVFFDRKSLQVGDEADVVIPRALRSSKMAVVLVDSDYSRSYYARAESVLAIALARSDPSYRVVPIYLRGRPPIIDTPYGLLLKQSLDFTAEASWEAVAQKLRYALGSMADSTGAVESVDSVSHPDPKVALIRRLPIGPRVNNFLVRLSLVQEFSDAAGPDRASDVLNEAVYLQLSANPEATYILPSHLPDPRFAGAFNYWKTAFSEACLHGPRMLAALLMAVDDSQFTDAWKNERDRLLSTLATWQGINQEVL